MPRSSIWAIISGKSDASSFNTALKILFEIKASDMPKRYDVSSKVILPPL